VTSSFVFDANKCTGCGACRVACTIENGLAPDVSWRRIETFNPQRRSVAPVFHLSLACNHCATAACMNACPAAAYRRDDVTGAVLLNSDLCIGCGYCSWACPYDAPVFDETAGVMTKCTWCADRLRVGLKPACVSHCPTGALGYAEVALSSRVMAMTGVPATTLEPSLHVIPLAPGRMQPMMVEVAPSVPLGPSAESPRGITLQKEWPLAVFTLGIASLVALITAAAAGALSIAPWLFVPSAVAVMAIAGAHLGRKDRGYRAVLNVRRSWLSREIVVVSLFVALASAWLLVAPSSTTVGWAAALVGFAGLVCADSVYGVLPGGPGYRHSASVLLTGAAIAAVAGTNVILAVPLVALKAWMYLNEARRLPSPATIVRAALGFAGPILFLGFAGNRTAALACLLAGEVIGRAEYYMQLTKRSPRREMDGALSLADSWSQHTAAITASTSR
jgi:Fe-S-cluster-containing dehydrogenase component